MNFGYDFPWNQPAASFEYPFCFDSLRDLSCGCSSILVGALVAIFYFPRVLGIIIPIDGPFFFRGVAQPPTSIFWEGLGWGNFQSVLFNKKQQAVCLHLLWICFPDLQKVMDCCIDIPRCFMYRMFTYVLAMFGVNVGKYPYISRLILRLM